MQPSLKQSEIDRLAAVFRENPRSVAFLPLANAYLASDRAADAIDVLEQGLAVHPDHAEGRLALGRALTMLHRWKDAEAELVKAVKLDRYSQQGFGLLGEILARRGNYDVAVKALTRACDLDPTDDRARRALERARIRRPLDPPPPLAGETQAVAQGPARTLALGSSVPAVSPFDDVDEGPTVVTLTPMAVPQPAPVAEESADTSVVMEPDGDPEVLEMPADLDVPDLSLGELAALEEAQPVVPALAEPESVPELAAAAAVPEPRFAPAPEPLPPAIPEPVPEPVPPPAAARPAERGRRRKSSVRPRVYPELQHVPTAEDYLNHVLGADRVVARSRDVTIDDGLPIESWGQRVKRPFLWLWLALGLATASGAAWFLGDMWARAAAVRRHLEAARAGLVEMSAASLRAAEDEATRAIARDPASVQAVATLANARAFALLVYGDGQLADVQTAIVAARQRTKEPKAGAEGKRELILARAAFALAAQSRGADVTRELEEARAELDGALASWPEEPLVFWLNGMARQASGDRAGAREALRQAQGLGLTMARVALADMDLDEGALAAAMTGYEEALRASPGHALALAGRALGKAEAGGELAEALAELSSGPEVKVDGKRAEAWFRLAVSRLARATGDLDRARTELDAAVATGTAEGRFLARASMALVDEGRFEDAFTARTRVRGRAAELLLPAVDAELLLAGGRPDEALRTIAAAQTARARLVRGRALLETGRAPDAVTQLEAAVAATPGDPVLQAWLALARLTVDPRQGIAPLAKIAGADAPAATRVLLGEGYLLLGESDKARRAFEGSIQDDPLAYVAATRLAELALDAGKPADAEAHARVALAAAPGYLPAHAALGRALVGTGRQSEAAPELQLAVEAGRARAADELAYAEAALASGEPDAAREALGRAREKGATPEALARVAALVDPQLAAELAAAAKPAKGKKARPRRRGR